jgi:hypothetical protein
MYLKRSSPSKWGYKRIKNLGCPIFDAPLLRGKVRSDALHLGRGVALVVVLVFALAVRLCGMYLLRNWAKTLKP